MSFAELASAPDPALDLLALAIAIARDEFPSLEDEPVTQAIDALASRVDDGLNANDESEADCWQAKLDYLAAVLFDEEGFAGNSADYYDPRNSYINEVLERKIGIPITLSLVYMEVGKRIGLSMWPISFPSHFLVRVDGPAEQNNSEPVIVDPFNRAQVLKQEELLQRLQQSFGSADVARAHLPRALSLAPRREVAMRMLRNLKAIYVQQNDWQRALRVTDRMVTLDPNAHSERRDRGAIYAKVGHLGAALEDLSAYLRYAPDAADAQAVRQQIAALAGKASRLIEL